MSTIATVFTFPPKRIASLSLVLLASAAAGGAENADELRRGALKGMKGCAVVAMSLNSAVTSEQARTAAVSRLRQAKIPAFESYSTVKDVPGKPTLTVIVSDFVSVRLAQEVLLKRDPSIATVAETWSSNCVAKDRAITDALRECLDQFVNDFRSANAHGGAKK